MIGNILLQRTLQSLSPWTRHWVQATSASHPLTISASPTVLARHFVPRMQSTEHFAQQIIRRHTGQTVAPVQRVATMPAFDSRPPKALPLVGQAVQSTTPEASPLYESPIEVQTSQQPFDLNVAHDVNTDATAGFEQGSFLGESPVPSERLDDVATLSGDRPKVSTRSGRQVQGLPMQQGSEASTARSVVEPSNPLLAKAGRRTPVEQRPAHSLAAMIDERIQRAQMGLLSISTEEGDDQPESTTMHMATDAERPQIRRSTGESSAIATPGTATPVGGESSSPGKSLVSMIEERIMRAQEGLPPIPPDEDYADAETDTEPSATLQAKPEGMASLTESALVQAQSAGENQLSEDASPANESQRGVVERPSLTALIDQRIRSAAREDTSHVRRPPLPPQVRRLMAYSAVEEISSRQVESPPSMPSVQRAATSRIVRKEKTIDEASQTEVGNEKTIVIPQTAPSIALDTPTSIPSDIPTGEKETLSDSPVPGSSTQTHKTGDAQSETVTIQRSALLAAPDPSIDNTLASALMPRPNRGDNPLTSSTIQRKTQETSVSVGDPQEHKRELRTQLDDHGKVNVSQPSSDKMDAAHIESVEESDGLFVDAAPDIQDAGPATTQTDTIMRREQLSPVAKVAPSESTTDVLSKVASSMALADRSAGDEKLNATQTEAKSDLPSDSTMNRVFSKNTVDEKIAPTQTTESSADESLRTVRRKHTEATSPLPTAELEQPTQSMTAEAIKPPLSMTKESDIQQNSDIQPRGEGGFALDQSFSITTAETESIKVSESRAETALPIRFMGQPANHSLTSPMQRVQRDSVAGAIDQSPAPAGSGVKKQTKPMLVLAVPRFRIQSKQHDKPIVEVDDSEWIDNPARMSSESAWPALERHGRSFGSSMRSNVQPSRPTTTVMKPMAAQQIVHRRAFEQTNPTNTATAETSRATLPQVIAVSTQPTAQTDSMTKSAVPDLDQLARQILPMIKRMIGIERERSPYR
jgi:hypothetical protein